jgi:ribonuclease P protein component
MISAQYRFHSRGGIKHTYAKGAHIRGQEISLVVVNNTGRKSSRFAVVVSKKVLKSAVGRNRIRRRVYEVIRCEMPKIKSVHDAVLSVYSQNVKEMPSRELKNIIVELFKEANLY